jgi:peptide chain release factor 1
MEKLLLDKLKLIEEKYRELEEKMASPEVYNDPAAVMKVSREQKELAPVVEAYREYVKHQRAAEEAKTLLSENIPDPELRQLAEEELSSEYALMAELEEKLKILLLPRDPNDSRNVIVEIGEEPEATKRLCLPIRFFGCI